MTMFQMIHPHGNGDMAFTRSVSGDAALALRPVRSRGWRL